MKSKQFEIKGQKVKIIVNGEEQEQTIKKAKLSDKKITLENAMKNFKRRQKDGS